MDMAKLSSHSWQCDLSGPHQRLEYLFKTGCFSDIVIKCPGGVSYNLHRVVLAMCSPVFEAMMFGPLATFHDCLCLEDDPEALKSLFEHCYGCDFQCDDINVLLEIFKIADKYLFHDLKNKCTTIIQNFIKPENFKTIYNFSVRYGYTDFRNSCIEFLQQDSNIIRATAVLMWFSQNSPKDLLMPIFAVHKIALDTWRNPKTTDTFGDLVTILQNSCCKDLQEFAGQVSGDVIKYMPGPLVSTMTERDPSYAPVLKFSIQNGTAKEVIMALHERFNKYGPEDIGIHITNEDIKSIYKELYNLPCYNCDGSDEFPTGRIILYFSDLSKENIYHLHSIISRLKPACENKKHHFVNSYMFPGCKLSKEDFSIFSEEMFQDEFLLLPYHCIRMCSPYLEMKDEEDLFNSVRNSLRETGNEIWEFFPYIKLYSSDSEIPGW